MNGVFHGSQVFSTQVEASRHIERPADIEVGGFHRIDRRRGCSPQAKGDREDRATGGAGDRTEDLVGQHIDAPTHLLGEERGLERSVDIYIQGVPAEDIYRLPGAIACKERGPEEAGAIRLGGAVSAIRRAGDRDGIPRIEPTVKAFIDQVDSDAGLDHGRAETTIPILEG